MIFIAILIGCILGAVLGMNAPMISYTYSSYLAIAVIAALDTVFGGIASVIKKNFDLKIFISGFFGNAILAILLTILGQKLNVDIYLAAIVVFVGRMFNNLGTIRRYYIEKWSTKKDKKDIIADVSDLFGSWDSVRAKQKSIAEKLSSEIYLDERKKENVNSDDDWKSDIYLNKIYSLFQTQQAFIWDNIYSNIDSLFDVHGTQPNHP